jgi:hypothetical protein
VPGGLLAADCASASPSLDVKLTGAQIAVLTNSGTAGTTAEVNNDDELLVQRCMEARARCITPCS